MNIRIDDWQKIIACIKHENKTKNRRIKISFRIFVDYKEKRHVFINYKSINNTRFFFLTLKILINPLDRIFKNSFHSILQN